MKKLEIINKKRISSFLFIAMLMITIMGTVVQAAGNYKDADIFIHYSGDGGDVGTKEREKRIIHLLMFTIQSRIMIFL